MYIEIKNVNEKTIGNMPISSFLVVMAYRQVPKEAIQMATCIYYNLESLLAKEQIHIKGFNYSFEFIPSGLSLPLEEVFEEAYDILKTKIIEDKGWSADDITIVPE